MHIFLDESGSFTGYHKNSISMVAALAIPDDKLSRLSEKYERIRRSLPKQNGEIKGRMLNELQVSRVVKLLAKNEAVLEATLVDLGLHQGCGILEYRSGLISNLIERLEKFNPKARPKIERAISQLRNTPAPLFLQALATFDLLSNVIQHVPLYFVQRKPYELGSFRWIVDGKDRGKVTSWEDWWSWYAVGALATRSIKYPAPQLEGADYSHFARFENSETNGIDLSLLLKDLSFNSGVDYGLEWVDILVNAMRRAVMGNLAHDGWADIPKLMIRSDNVAVSLVLFKDGPEQTIYPDYAKVLRHFVGGKSMLTRSTYLRGSNESEAERL